METTVSWFKIIGVKSPAALQDLYTIIHRPTPEDEETPVDSPVPDYEVPLITAGSS